MPGPRRPFLALVAGALWAVVSVTWVSAPAHGHTVLRSSTPADGATVERAPSEAVLTFSEEIDPMLSVVHVLDSSGRQVEVGRSEVVPGTPSQLRVDLGELAQGAYTLAWRVTSAPDGHTTTGSVAFGVRTPAAPAGAEGGQAVVTIPAPTAASVAGRWSFYVGVVVMLGAAVVGVGVASSAAVISAGLLAAAWVAAAGGLVLTVADQHVSTRTNLADLLSSSTGQKLAVQALAVALAGLGVAWACLRPSRLSLTAVGVGAAAAMLGRALAGHANASSPRWFTVGTQWIHLVAVGAWVGGLVWLLVAMRRGDAGRRPGLARRFSSVATATLAVVAVSGGVRALDEVGAWRRLVGTTFGLTLLAKLCLFAGLVALGARSRVRHVRSASPGRTDGLRRSVQGAVAIAIGALGVTAVLAGLPPSSSLAAASGPNPVTPTGPSEGEAPVASGGCGAAQPDPRYSVTIEPETDRAHAEGTTLNLAVRRDGRPVTGARVCVTADMPGMQHPGVSTVASEASPGSYDATLQFSMAGAWEGSITIVEPGRPAVSVPLTFEAR